MKPHRTRRSIGPSTARPTTPRRRGSHRIVRTRVRCSSLSGCTNTIPYVVVRRNSAVTRITVPAHDVTVIRTRGPAMRRVKRSRRFLPATSYDATIRRANAAGASTTGSPARARSCATRKCCTSNPLAPIMYHAASITMSNGSAGSNSATERPS